MPAAKTSSVISIASKVVPVALDVYGPTTITFGAVLMKNGEHEVVLANAGAGVIVTNRATRRSAILAWDDLIEAAGHAGINEE